jgi:hypothetical protein
MLATTAPFFRDEAPDEVTLNFHCSCGRQFDTVVRQVVANEPIRAACPSCRRVGRYSWDGLPLSY